MTNDSPDDPDIRQNAGRCDICGKHIVMDDGDVLVVEDFRLDDEITEEHGITDQDAADTIADALERVGDTVEDRALAHVIREHHEMKVHETCENNTALDRLHEGPEGND